MSNEDKIRMRQLQPHKGLGVLPGGTRLNSRAVGRVRGIFSFAAAPVQEKGRKKAPVGGVTMNNLDLLRKRLVRGWEKESQGYC